MDAGQKLIFDYLRAVFVGPTQAPEQAVLRQLAGSACPAAPALDGAQALERNRHYRATVLRICRLTHVVTGCRSLYRRLLAHIDRQRSNTPYLGRRHCHGRSLDHAPRLAAAWPVVVAPVRLGKFARTLRSIRDDNG
jgi:hypothetical protein